jgi:hypothetical protein
MWIRSDGKKFYFSKNELVIPFLIFWWGGDFLLQPSFSDYDDSWDCELWVRFLAFVAFGWLSANYPFAEKGDIGRRSCFTLGGEDGWLWRLIIRALNWYPCPDRHFYLPKSFLNSWGTIKGSTGTVTSFENLARSTFTGGLSRFTNKELTAPSPQAVRLSA